MPSRLLRKPSLQLAFWVAVAAQPCCWAAILITRAVRLAVYRLPWPFSRTGGKGPRRAAAAPRRIGGPPWPIAPIPRDRSSPKPEKTLREVRPAHRNCPTQFEKQKNKHGQTFNRAIFTFTFTRAPQGATLGSRAFGSTEESGLPLGGNARCPLNGCFALPLQKGTLPHRPSYHSGAANGMARHWRETQRRGVPLADLIENRRRWQFQNQGARSQAAGSRERAKSDKRLFSTCSRRSSGSAVRRSADDLRVPEAAFGLGQARPGLYALLRKLC